jgi:hypothetical protein
MKRIVAMAAAITEDEMTIVEVIEVATAIVVVMAKGGYGGGNDNGVNDHVG